MSRNRGGFRHTISIDIHGSKTRQGKRMKCMRFKKNLVCKLPPIILIIGGVKAVTLQHGNAVTLQLENVCGESVARV